MAPAPSWNTCRVYGTWHRLDGTMRAGTYKITLPVRVTNATDDVIIPAGVVATGELNTTAGVPSLDVQVPANNDPDNSPNGWQAVVEVTFHDAAGEKYVIDTPVDGEVNLRTVVLAASIPVPKDVLIRGVPGGLAELDAEGKVVAEQLPEGIGGGPLTARTLPLSNGEDDTAAINAVLASVTGPTVVRGVPGENYLISAPLVVRSSTTLDMTHCTVTQKPGSNTNSLRNWQVDANDGRDSDITIIGGTWDKGANGGSGTGLHHLMLRRVDRLVVRDMQVKATAGKYGISIADTNVFEVHHIDFATSSDGVHLNGKCFNGSVHHITGSTGDDSVAITGNDYTNYADVIGDVKNVRVYAVTTTSGSRSVIVNAGAGCTADDIEVRDIRGTSVQAAVRIGQDAAQPGTTGGTYGRIRVEDVTVACTGTATLAQVQCEMPNGRLLDIRRITPAAGAVGRRLVYINIDTGVTVAAVDVRDLAVDGRAVDGIVVNGGGTIQRLTVDRPALLNMPDADNGALVTLTGSVAVQRLQVTNPDLSCDATNTTKWIGWAAGCTIGSIAVLGGRVSKGRDLFEANSGTTITLDNGLVLDGINRTTNLYSGAYTFVLGTVTFNSNVNSQLWLNSTATGLTVIGGQGVRNTGSTVLIGRNSTQPIRVNGPTIRVDAALVADAGNTGHDVPQVGDTFFNTSAHSPLPANHPVIVTAVAAGKPTVKSLIDGSTWTVP